MVDFFRFKSGTNRLWVPQLSIATLTCVLFMAGFPLKSYSRLSCVELPASHQKIVGTYPVQVFSDTAVSPKDTSSLSSTSFISPGAGLPHFAALIHKGSTTIKVAFLGGSITHMKGWRDLVMDYLIKTYPQTTFEFLDAGIPSLGSVPHAFRFQNDVLDKMRPDLLFIESAVNDAGNGTTIMEQKRALEGIIRQAHRASSSMDIILMAFADEAKNAAYRQGSVPPCVRVHQDVAAYYELPFINLAKEVYTRIRLGEFSWENDFKSLHPAPFGQKLYFNAIKTLLEQQISKVDEPGQVPASTSKAFPGPLVSKNYSQGHYVDLDRARILQGFKWIDDWKPADKVPTRPGFVHVPVLSGTTPGDRLELDFTGTAVGIAVLSGPDCGVVSYQIDDGPFKNMDLYTRWSSGLYLPWYEMLGDGLNNEKHVLKLIIAPSNRKSGNRILSAQKNGAEQELPSVQAKTAVRIVHFLVNGPNP